MITLSYQKLMRFGTNRRFNRRRLYELLCCLSINQQRIKALSRPVSTIVRLSAPSESAKSDSRLRAKSRVRAYHFTPHFVAEQVPTVSSSAEADTCLPAKIGEQDRPSFRPPRGNKKCELIDVRSCSSRFGQTTVRHRLFELAEVRYSQLPLSSIWRNGM